MEKAMAVSKTSKSRSWQLGAVDTKHPVTGPWECRWECVRPVRDHSTKHRLPSEPFLKRPQFKSVNEQLNWKILFSLFHTCTHTNAKLHWYMHPITWHKLWWDWQFISNVIMAWVGKVRLADRWGGGGGSCISFKMQLTPQYKMWDCHFTCNAVMAQGEAGIWEMVGGGGGHHTW